MVGVIILALATAALVVDGGNAWAQQRIAQNAADAAAEAGAIVLAEKLSGALEPSGGWDGRVDARIHASADANGVAIQAAYYTDMCGIPLRPNGQASLLPDGITEDLVHAATVGDGFPDTAGITPDCPSRTVGPPAGVLVITQKDFKTYYGSAIGITQMTALTRATAAAGWLQGICDPALDETCSLLPVTIPVTPIKCDNNGEVQPAPELGPEWAPNTTYRIPLCKNGPHEPSGNVGWIDWTPPSGGTSELVDEIVHPNNPPLALPTWEYVSQSGNPNAQAVEEALRAYDGQVVLIPMFDLTCNSEPDPGQADDGPNYGCPSEDLQGHGSQWYRFPWFAAFQLCGPGNTAADCAEHGAYTSGAEACGSEWSGAWCLVGQFVNIIKEGTISANGGGGSGPSKVVGIQLIK